VSGATSRPCPACPVTVLLVVTGAEVVCPSCGLCLPAHPDDLREAGYPASGQEYRAISDQVTETLGSVIARSEAFLLLADLARMRQVPPLNTLPGCWEFTLPGGWWVAVNGHEGPVESAEGPVPPYHAWVRLNEWPVAILNPADGVFTGAGSEEDRFIAALREAIAAETPRTVAP